MSWRFGDNKTYTKRTLHNAMWRLVDNSNSYLTQISVNHVRKNSAEIDQAPLQNIIFVLIYVLLLKRSAYNTHVYVHTHTYTFTIIMHTYIHKPFLQRSCNQAPSTSIKMQITLPTNHYFSRYLFSINKCITILQLESGPRFLLSSTHHIVSPIRL